MEREAGLISWRKEEEADNHHDQGDLQSLTALAAHGHGMSPPLEGGRRAWDRGTGDETRDMVRADVHDRVNTAAVCSSLRSTEYSVMRSFV